MACDSCGNAACTCATRVHATITFPQGDPQCPESPTEPCDPSACCNYFSRNTEGGNDFLYSVGGPFPLEVLDCLNTGACQEPICGPRPIPNAGPVSEVLCLDLTPGTYQIHFRAELFEQLADSLAGGARIVALWRPRCDSDLDEIVIADCQVPCINGDSPELKRLLCCCTLDVWNPGCQAGIRIIATPGCPVNPEEPRSTVVQNLQVKVLENTERDLVNCAGFPLVTSDAEFSDSLCGDTVVVSHSPISPPCADGCADPLIQIQFSNRVLHAEDPGNIIVQEVDAGGAPVGAPVLTNVTMSPDGTLATVQPQGGACLNGCSRYKVQLSDLIVDCCGAPIQGGAGLTTGACNPVVAGATQCFSWIFETCPSQAFILSTDPADGETDVDISLPNGVQFVYSEDVTVNGTVLEEVQNAQPLDCANAIVVQPVMHTVSGDGTNVITLTPNNLPLNQFAAYRATVTVTDNCGNQIVTQICFVTGGQP